MKQNNNNSIYVSSEVLYNEELTPIEKLILIEITNECNEWSYIEVVNNKLSIKFNRHITIISRVLKSLMDKWFIKLDFTNRNRRIYLIKTSNNA